MTTRKREPDEVIQALENALRPLQGRPLDQVTLQEAQRTMNEVLDAIGFCMACKSWVHRCEVKMRRNQFYPETTDVAIVCGLQLN